MMGKTPSHGHRCYHVKCIAWKYSYGVIISRITFGQYKLRNTQELWHARTHRCSQENIKGILEEEDDLKI